MAEIAAASNEQAQGIEQVNTAVAEMDKVVQQNAANAEENASASEEMNAQAEQMKEYVGELVAMVGGSRQGSGDAREVTRTQPKRITRNAITAPVNQRKEKTVADDHNAKEVSPDQVIPMEESDFKDF